MKKLGLVGGTGPESTLMYYRDINHSVYEKTNGKAFPELSIESVNLYRAVQYCQEQRYEELTAYLLQAVCHLAQSGAEFAALTANTVHIVFDAVNRQSPIPLVSIVEAACEQAKRRKLKRVGLLGTIFTMKGNFFQETFSREGIEVLTPSDMEMELVNDRIANELELGIVKETTRQELIQVIKDMRKREKLKRLYWDVRSSRWR